MSSTAITDKLGTKPRHQPVGYQIRRPSGLADRLTFQVFSGPHAIAFAQLSARQGNRRQASALHAAPGVSYCLKKIEVSQQYRGQGVGSALLQEIIGFCRDQRVRSLHGEAKGDLPQLRRWYSEQGFTLDSVNNISLQLVEQP